MSEAGAIARAVTRAGDVIDDEPRRPLPPTPEPLHDDPAEPDRVRGGWIAAAIAAVLAIVVGSGIGVGLVVSRDRDVGGESDVRWPDVELPPADPFTLPSAHELRRAEQRARRERWEWSDRAQGRVRRPLALAIDAYVAEHAAAVPAAPAPADPGAQP